MTTRERAEIISQKIAEKLSAHGFIAPVKLIADVLQPIMFPPYCEGCGLRMCPLCDEHAVPGLDGTDNDYEKLELCIQCKVYIKRDDSTLPMNSADVRIEMLAQLQDEEEQDDDEEKPPKEYVN